MADIKDPAYLYVDNPDHPAHGKTIEVEMEEFKANVEEWKALGIRPATGKELAPVGARHKAGVAADHPGTAALMGGLRGATFGLSDVAVKALGDEESAEDLKTLREENPKASMSSELAGGLVTGGGAARAGMKAAASIPSALARASIGGATAGGLMAGGSELGRQAREEEEYDFSDVVGQGVKGAVIGAALPVAARGVSAGASKVGELGLRGTGATARLGEKATGAINQAVERGSANPFGRLARGSAAMSTGGTSEAVIQGSKVAHPILGKVAQLADKGLQSQQGRRAVDKLAREIQDLNPGTGLRKARELARKIMEREVETASVTINEGARSGARLSTEAMRRHAQQAQAGRRSFADFVDEDVRLILDKF